MAGRPRAVKAGLEGPRGVSRRRLGRLATRLPPDLRLLLLPERLPFVGTRSKLRPHLVLHPQQQLVEGPLRGAGVVAGGGWRAPASLGFGVKTVNGVSVPDVNIIQWGKAETAVDFSFGYSGKSKWIGDRKYTLGLNIRNAFPSDKYVARNRDFFTGASLTTMRPIPRQFVYSCEVDL